MKNSKLKYQKKREHFLKMQEQADAKLIRNENRLKSVKGGFALHGIERACIVSPPYTGHKEVVIRRNYQGTLPAKADPIHEDRPKRIYTSEEMVREARAQAEIHEKKKWSMPLYNKGPIQSPTSEDIKAMKNGELRRRS